MKELYSAFVKFNLEFEGLKADGSNPFFKSSYITLDGILQTVRPLLAKHGLAIMQVTFTEEVATCVKTLLIHESGEQFETEVLKMKPAKEDPQARGSLITYMKRYQLGALLGICESVDDDGNKCSEVSNSITEKQINRLYAIGKSAGFEVEVVKNHVLKKYKKAVDKLTKEEYEAVCTGYENVKKA